LARRGAVTKPQVGVSAENRSSQEVKKGEGVQGSGIRTVGGTGSKAPLKKRVCPKKNMSTTVRAPKMYRQKG